MYLVQLIFVNILTHYSFINSSCFSSGSIEDENRSDVKSTVLGKIDNLPDDKSDDLFSDDETVIIRNVTRHDGKERQPTTTELGTTAQDHTSAYSSSTPVHGTHLQHPEVDNVMAVRLQKIKTTINLLNKDDASVPSLDERPKYKDNTAIITRHGLTSLPVLAMMLNRQGMNYYMPSINHHKASLQNFLKGPSPGLPGMLENARNRYRGVNMDKKIEIFLYVIVTASQKSVSLGVDTDKMFNLPSLYPIITKDKENNKRTLQTYSATSKHTYANHPNAVGHPLTPTIWNNIIKMLGFERVTQVTNYQELSNDTARFLQRLSQYNLDSRESIEKFAWFIPRLRQRFLYDESKNIHHNYRAMKLEFTKACPLRVGMIEGMHRTLLTSMYHEGIDVNGILNIRERDEDDRLVTYCGLHRFYKPITTVFRTPAEHAIIDNFLRDARLISLDAAQQDIVAIRRGTKDEFENALTRIMQMYNDEDISFDGSTEYLFWDVSKLVAFYKHWMFRNVDFIVDWFISDAPTSLFREEITNHIKARRTKFGGEKADKQIRLNKMKGELRGELLSTTELRDFYVSWTSIPRQSTKVLPKQVAPLLSTFLMIAAYHDSIKKFINIITTQNFKEPQIQDATPDQLLFLSGLGMIVHSFCDDFDQKIETWGYYKKAGKNARFYFKLNIMNNILDIYSRYGPNPQMKKEHFDNIQDPEIKDSITSSSTTHGTFIEIMKNIFPAWYQNLLNNNFNLQIYLIEQGYPKHEPSFRHPKNNTRRMVFTEVKPLSLMFAFDMLFTGKYQITKRIEPEKLPTPRKKQKNKQTTTSNTTTSKEPTTIQVTQQPIQTVTQTQPIKRRTSTMGLPLRYRQGRYPTGKSCSLNVAHAKIL